MPQCLACQGSSFTLIDGLYFCNDCGTQCEVRRERRTLLTRRNRFAVGYSTGRRARIPPGRGNNAPIANSAHIDVAVAKRAAGANGHVRKEESEDDRTQCATHCKKKERIPGSRRALEKNQKSVGTAERKEFVHKSNFLRG